ncbi:hypothetical protein N9D23_11680, partial [Rubripirellula sp.]|nr:hypothetical protein [Rubripirellula sp.]
MSLQRPKPQKTIGLAEYSLDSYPEPSVSIYEGDSTTNLSSVSFCEKASKGSPLKFPELFELGCNLGKQTAQE